MQFKVKDTLFPALPIITQSNNPEIITIDILPDFEKALLPLWKWDYAMLISYFDFWVSFLFNNIDLAYLSNCKLIYYINVPNLSTT